MEKFRVTKINDPVLDEFLKEHDVKDKFINNCNRDYNDIPFIVSEKEKDDCRKEVELEDVYLDVIANSFPWTYTPEEEEFWELLHNKFVKTKVRHLWKVSNYNKICLN